MWPASGPPSPFPEGAAGSAGKARNCVPCALREGGPGRSAAPAGDYGLRAPPPRAPQRRTRSSCLPETPAPGPAAGEACAEAAVSPEVGRLRLSGGAVRLRTRPGLTLSFEKK